MEQNHNPKISGVIVNDINYVPADGGEYDEPYDAEPGGGDMDPDRDMELQPDEQEADGICVNGCEVTLQIIAHYASFNRDAQLLR